ncbi:MAG: hypothetical protein M3438_07965 [Pseudomonadota bacterium]|nr:hypothetical protein [Sphingomonas sp.]MDQ3479075.1 hypothetical protein [Pseudomonadota bacterium]
MELRRATDWVKAHRWWVALVLVIVAGYSIGKDLALRDNRQAAAQTEAS